MTTCSECYEAGGIAIARHVVLCPRHAAVDELIKELERLTIKIQEAGWHSSEIESSSKLLKRLKEAT